MEKPKQRKKKHIAKPQYKNMNAFKAAEKHYKLYQGLQTDFTALYIPDETEILKANGYEVWELPFPAGAYLVKKFIPIEKVVEVGLCSLNQFWMKPYRTNLDSRQQLYAEEGQNKVGEEKIMQQGEKRQKVEDEIEEDKGYLFNDKIRWANVGYQYDWTLRKYPDKKTNMHPLIKQLTTNANSLFNSIKQTKRQYEPQSAIVNYYGVKDYMTGHLDDAEEDQESPIYSFSFGLSCVFVIGGRTKEEKPTAVRLDSGDLFIMSGQSRKCYHGVPRIIEQSFNVPAAEDPVFQYIATLANQTPNSYKNVFEYFRSHRVNINIRQVFPRPPPEND